MFYIGLFLSLLMSNAPSIYDFSVNAIDGSKINFADFKGKKILVVNTASKCGFTPQYADLEKLYEQNKDKLVIIGFPANNFMEQEPGTNKEIFDFCKKNYGVSFPMAEKISVKGEDIHLLYKWLISIPNPDYVGDIRWNFEKFLFDENGNFIQRFKPKVKPMSKEVIKAIE